MADRLATSTLACSTADTYQTDPQEAALVSALCAGSEAAFALLIDQYHPAMVRLASRFVCGHAAAEDVVQDVWLIVVRGITMFEGRCSLKSWIFRILTNRAQTAGQREGRIMPISVIPETTWTGREPRSIPEDSLLMEDVMGIVRGAIRDLPENQRQVITLRDIEDRGATEVCQLLRLTDGNQRVLLHRARSMVRQRVQDYHDQLENEDVG